MWQVYHKELRAFLHSLIAYLVIIVFLLATGVFIWVIPQTGILGTGISDLSDFFFRAPMVFLLLIPAITMRCFAEERKSGTLELLLTLPLSDVHIIVGKYLAALTVVVLALIPTLVYYGSVYWLGLPAGNIDSAGFFGSFIGLCLLSAVFTAVGVFASSLTDSQIIAFILAVLLCFILYFGFDLIAEINVWGIYSEWFRSFGISYHYGALSKGLIDSRDVVYFLSVIVFMMLSTKLVLGIRNW
jgi:ABC-2 type transport system permease protein